MRKPLIALLFLLLSPLPAFAGPVVVFDLDRTLFDISGRVNRILSDIGATTITREEATSKSSPFGQRFYFEPAYLIHDTPIPGAQAFVARIAQELGADVVYLTARYQPVFESETREQLRRHGFPEGRLIMKPSIFERTPAYKVRSLLNLPDDGRAVAVFDDSKSNVRAFVDALPATTAIVQPVASLDGAAPAPAGVFRIVDYTGDMEAIIEKARRCAEALRR